MRSKQRMEEFVFDLLNNQLPDYCFYHNLEHTQYVMEKAIEIGQQEHCSQTETDLLTTAALWHDTGHIHKYAGHEEESCLLARQYLPQFGYDESEIELVCGMIMATKTPQTPLNRLEEIVADADLEYLGTDSVAEKSNLLFREIQALDPAMTRNDWLNTQISFIQKHHYFTPFCITHKQPMKAVYLDRLEHMLDK